MKRAFVWSLAVLVIYLGVLVVGCKKHEIVDGTKTDSSDTARNTVTDVAIKFNGAIAHVFATTTDSTPKPIYRSVFLLSNKNVDAMPVEHLAEMVLPDTVIEKELIDATGAGILVTTNTDFHFTRVAPLDKLTIRLVGSDGTTTDIMEPALDKTDTDFIKQVPSIHLASAKTMIEAELKDSLRNPAAYPDGTDFAAFFLLEGGKFASKKFCKPTKFKENHDGNGVHDFGEWITLSGKLKKAPVLLISRGNGAPMAVHFKNLSNKLVIQFINQPLKTETVPHSHFDMYKRLAKDPTKFKYPNTWDEVEEITCSEHGPVPGCSNSAWP